jgi:hypothetical protein
MLRGLKGSAYKLQENPEFAFFQCGCYISEGLNPHFR